MTADFFIICIQSLFVYVIYALSWNPAEHTDLQDECTMYVKVDVVNCYAKLIYHSVSCRQIGTCNHELQKSYCFNSYCVINVAVVLKFGKHYNKYRKQLTKMENIKLLFQTLEENINYDTFHQKLWKKIIQILELSHDHVFVF